MHAVSSLNSYSKIKNLAVIYDTTTLDKTHKTIYDFTLPEQYRRTLMIQSKALRRQEAR